MVDQATNQVADEDGEDLDREQALLRNTLRLWQVTQQQILPQLGSPLPVDEERPELTPLRLPSSFTPDQQQQYGLMGAIPIELQLRRDEAFNTLSDLRDTIHEYNQTVTEKRINPGSQKIGTRVQVQLAEIKLRMEELMRQYMLSFTALIALGCSTHEEGLRPLDKSQLWGKNVFVPHVTGDSSSENPWFWSVGKPAGLSEASWLIERKFMWLAFK